MRCVSDFQDRHNRERVVVQIAAPAALLVRSEWIGDIQEIGFVSATSSAPNAAVECSGNEVVIIFPSPSGVSALAAAVSAARKAGGNSFPRLSARRRMPAQARGLK